MSPEKIAHLIVFLVTALLVSSWSVARRRAEDALRQGRDELEAKIMERTADLSSSNEQLRFEIAERERVEAALNEKASLLNLTHDTVSYAISTTPSPIGIVVPKNGTVGRAKKQLARSLTSLCRPSFPSPSRGSMRSCFVEAAGRESLYTRSETLLSWW